MEEKQQNLNEMYDFDEIYDEDHYGVKAASTDRRFIGVEPNISVRPQYTKHDFEAFRSQREIPTLPKEKIRECMKAYEHIGIVSTIIDLMGDFGCQGIHVVHSNPNSEKFLKEWSQRVNMAERSERFLNTLFRCGTVIVKRKYGRISAKTKRQMTRAKKRIPIEYKLLNPLMVEVKDPKRALFTGEYKYVLLPPSHILNMLNKKDMISNTKFQNSSDQYDPGNKEIPLKNEDIEVYHYKKDDWNLWGSPLINPILDDLYDLEHMKLADRSALDGVISNVRLWKLGIINGPTDSILPTKTAIARLRNILASNVGGGTMDLVWGPELDFKESATEAYKWLGEEKYIPIYNAIYSGLGIPPILTGMSDSSGSFTGNFVSLKIMIDRLEYGRKMLVDFWTKEIKSISKKLGIRGNATIKFDHMALHDEAAEKKLLIELADRSYISVETLQHRFNEDPEIEKYRIEREYKEIEEGKRPPKAGPYHEPHLKEKQDHELKKQDKINKEKQKEFKPKVNEGRPKNATDKEPRKKRRVLPNVAVQIYARKAFNQISELCTPLFLEINSKSNLRQLTKEQVEDLEWMKFTIFSNTEVEKEISLDSIIDTLQTVGIDANSEIEKEYEDIVSVLENPSIEDRREAKIMAYVNKNIKNLYR